MCFQLQPAPLHLGVVQDVVIRDGKKAKGSALVVFAEQGQAAKAATAQCGDPINPLLAVRAAVPPPGYSAGKQSGTAAGAGAGEARAGAGAAGAGAEGRAGQQGQQRQQGQPTPPPRPTGIGGGGLFPGGSPAGAGPGGGGRGGGLFPGGAAAAAPPGGSFSPLGASGSGMALH